ncbi:PQQ-binding-like beta-propeller repeat protein [Mycobacterium aquaticum]|nr:PQQ-binding-like beta-propeller repeat protein [Mycobacterium aquaticum]
MNNGEAPAGGVARQPRQAAAWLGLGVGAAVGATVLGGYGFVRRTPSGVHETSVTAWAAGSVVLLTVGALALIWTARSALTGADLTRRSSLLLTAIVAVAAYALLADRDGLAASTSTAMALLRLSWAVLAIAAILVVAGAVATAGRAAAARLWGNLVPALVIGLVLALVSGASVHARTDTALTATPIDIPAAPTTVGTNVAYALPTKDPSFIAPAGPGFVMLDGDALNGYSGQTGQLRWRLPFAMVGGNCEPSSVRSTGTSAGSVVIAQCLRHKPSSDSSVSEWHAVLTGIDAMTGHLLWTNGDNWRIRSTIVTGPDVIPVVRAGEVGALDPHTGKLWWTKQFDQGECGGNIVGTGDQAQSILYFAVCASPITLHVADGRTGTERTIPIEAPHVGSDIGRTELAAAAGDVVVIAVSSAERDIQEVTLAVDIRTGDTMTVPVKYLRQDRNSFQAGQYPGPVLQLSGGSDGATVYLVAQRRTLRTTTPTSTLDRAIMDGQRWAVVGDQLVTATAVTAAYRSQLATVTLGGTAVGHPSPCGANELGGVIVVPGAVLAVCARTVREEVTGYVITGIH